MTNTTKGKEMKTQTGAPVLSETILSADFATRMPPGNVPCADTDELAAQGRRIMIHRDCHKGQFSMFIAPRHVLTAGYVLAVEVNGPCGTR